MTDLNGGSEPQTIKAPPHKGPSVGRRPIGPNICDDCRLLNEVCVYERSESQAYRQILCDDCAGVSG